MDPFVRAGGSTGADLPCGGAASRRRWQPFGVPTNCKLDVDLLEFPADNEIKHP